MNWRDWSIPAKLAAVTLVPVVFAVVLGAMQIGDQVHRAENYRMVDRLIAVNEQLRPLVDALQRERSATAALVAAGPATFAERVGELSDERLSVNNSRDELLRAARRVTFHNQITPARYDEVNTRLGELNGIRDAAGAGKLNGRDTLAGYTSVIAALLSFDRAASSEVIDPALAATVVALHDLELAKEEIRYQQAVVGIGLVAGGLADDQQTAVRTSQSRLADRLADFHLDADSAQQQNFAGLVAGPGVETRQDLVTAALSVPPGRPLPVDATEWRSNSDLAAGRTAAVSAVLGSRVDEQSTALQGGASDGAGLASVILLAALVIAAAVMIMIGRQLLGSLNVLRRTAWSVARNGLPAAVERIRDGRGGGVEPVVEPVPVRTADEVGQVARAFDAVHRQALRLATEQAGLRARYGDVFINLSRRSQGLVQRQLRLLEQLERDEEDPEQLATLFQLDHLATRMRRNNENLVVLSGGELSRRTQRPATLSDLLRAAVSEIEQYQRVVLLPPPDVLIVGYAVGDLVRLVAELLDNATAFSPPGTQVTIAAHSFEDDSVCVAILDEGIGMSESELSAANAKLADASSIDLSTSRRMGLFVVGRLASRHGVEVSLHGGDDIPGVRATVALPAELVTRRSAPALDPGPGQDPGPTGQAAAAGQAGQVNGHGPAGAAGSLVPSPLPRRAKPANGSSTPDIARRLLGPDQPEPDQPEPDQPVPDPAPVAEPVPGALVDPADIGDAPTLPRRSPGGTQFAKPVDTAAGPVDLALPGGAPEGNGGLLRPGEEGWWSSSGRFDAATLEFAAGSAAAHGFTAESTEETTPIFAEMVSAWFRSLTDHDVRPDEQWQFAADAGFEAAQEVSQSQPDSFTDGGLPRRTPRQNLVPGSAGTPEDDPDEAGLGRDPTEVRGRLNDYQQGVTRARDERMVADEIAAAGGSPAGMNGAGWRFAARPDVTASGLPRRAPRPPAQPAEEENGGLRVDLAAELRGRLGELQRGLSLGRRSVDDGPPAPGAAEAADEGRCETQADL